MKSRKNWSRNIKGTHKGKKAKNPYMSYMDKQEIIEKKYQEDANREMFGDESQYLDDDIGCK